MTALLSLFGWGWRVWVRMFWDTSTEKNNGMQDSHTPTGGFHKSKVTAGTAESSNSSQPGNSGGLMGLNGGGGVLNTTTFQNKPNLGTSHISLQYYLFFLNTTSLQMCVLLIWNQNGKNKRLNSDNTPPSPGSAHLKTTISLQYGTSVKIKSPESILGEENISKILRSSHFSLP